MTDEMQKRMLTEAVEQDTFISMSIEEKREILRSLAREGKILSLRYLCEHAHGLPLEKDDHDRTLLHEAAQGGHAEMIRFCLDTLRMDPLEANSAGETPLEMAYHSGKGSVFEEIAGISLKDCYRNPVIRGFFPDPSIVWFKDGFYTIHSSFSMLPALPILYTKDLVHFKTVTHVFVDEKKARLEGIPGGFGYWAPDISVFKGRIWVTATLRRPQAPLRLQMITSAPSPEGPFDEPRFLPIDGIDPSLFTDVDGRRYMVTNPGVRLTEISDSGEMLSETRQIYYGDTRIKSEGPHIIFRDGWYYVFQAEGGTGPGHMVSCARSKNLYGPYEKCPFNPILTSKPSDGYIRRAGHGKPFCLPDGNWAMIYLCSRNVDSMTLMGRESAVDPLEWTSDGWPMVNSLKGASCLQKCMLPSAPLGSEPDTWLSPAISPSHFMSESDGTIRLKGGADRFCLHRQREPYFTHSVEINVSELTDGDFSGLVSYYDQMSFLALCAQRSGNETRILLTEKAGETKETVILQISENSHIRLEMQGIRLHRRLLANGHLLTERYAPYLADEALPGKRFTGATLGLMMSGNGTAVFHNYLEKQMEKPAES